jgi:hypothetical protein
MAEGGVPRYVGDGTNHWTLVHVDDLAELYALALERAPAGTLVNGVAGPPLRVKDMAEAAAAGAGFAAPPASWPVAEAAAEIGPEDADGVTRDHRISGGGPTLLGWGRLRGHFWPAARSGGTGSGSRPVMPDTRASNGHPVHQRPSHDRSGCIASGFRAGGVRPRPPYSSPHPPRQRAAVGSTANLAEAGGRIPVNKIVVNAHATLRRSARF